MGAGEEGSLIRRTPFDVPLLIFLAAACVGTFIVAWDPMAAQAKLAAIIGGIVVYYALVWLPREVGGHNVTRGIAIIAPALLGIVFLFTFDWSYRVGKVGFLDPIMRTLAAVRLPIGVELLNSNSAGGLLAALIPFQAQALFARSPRPVGEGTGDDYTRRGRWARAPLFALSLFALLLSASRGAWVALGLVTALWGVHRIVRRAWLAALIFAAVCLGGWLILGDWLLRAVAEDRIQVWTGSFDLAMDYAITGIGPANFAMPYASYVILSHVPYLAHAHNLYLDVWLDGGGLGLAALLMLLVTVMWQSRKTGEWRVAAYGAIATVALHGLTDDALYAYAPLAQVLMWLPLAVIARASPEPALRTQAVQLAVAGGAGALAALAVLIASPVRSAWEVNLGAMAQSKLELPGYTYERWGQQDKLRRGGILDYTAVRRHYEDALTLDANNAMANRRLAQLDIPAEDYRSARGKLERAFAVAPLFRATRQMLGEMLAVDEEPERAAALWRTIDGRQNQLALRLSWYRDFIGDAERARRMEAAIAVTGQN